MMTINDAVKRIAERSYDNARDIRCSNYQRRTKVVDLYGVEYNRVGDADNPAEIYISISPDLLYYERFQFKLIVGPQSSSTPTWARNFTFSIDNYVLEGDTPSGEMHLLSVQDDGNWIDGEGIYPKNGEMYDVLQVASDLYALGEKEDIERAEKILQPREMKVIRMRADGPFEVTLLLYLKYSHVNR